MNKLGHSIARTALGLAVAALAGHASANVGYITFDNTSQNIYTNGDTFTDGAGVLTTVGQGGFDGAVVDSSSCFLAVCPVGNDSQFYAGLNDGGLKVTLGAELLHMTSLDFGFVLPLPKLLGASVGQLLLTGVDALGGITTLSKNFGLQDGNGDFGFEHWALDAAFTAVGFKSVTISACLFDDKGGCVNPAGNQAQFAVDNIGFVPEPAGLALVGVSLAGLLAAGRRRKAS